MLWRFVEEEENCLNDKNQLIMAARILWGPYHIIGGSNRHITIAITKPNFFTTTTTTKGLITRHTHSLAELHHIDYAAESDTSAAVHARAKQQKLVVLIECLDAREVPGPLVGGVVAVLTDGLVV